MRAALLLLTVAILGLTACTGSSPRSDSGTGTDAVLFGGDPSKIPLDGTSASPLRWEQPSDLSGDAADVASDYHRLSSLLQILSSGPQRPQDVRLDPLLSQFVDPSGNTSVVANWGDQDTGRFEGTAAIGTIYRKVVAVQVVGDAATLSYCNTNPAVPAGSAGPLAATWTRATGDSAVRWRLQSYLDTSPVSYDCNAWAAALPSATVSPS